MIRRQWCPVCQKKENQISLATEYLDAFNCQRCGRLLTNGKCGDEVWVDAWKTHRPSRRRYPPVLLKTPAGEWTATLMGL